MARGILIYLAVTSFRLSYSSTILTKSAKTYALTVTVSPSRVTG